MKVFNTISSLFLAGIILFSSMGLVLNKHYCGGELKSVSLHSTHATCGMCESAIKAPSCHKTTENKDCCENEKIYLDTQDYKINLSKVNVNEPTLLYSFTLIEVPGNLSLTNTFNKEHKTFKPPTLLTKNIPVLVQSFLI